MLMDADLQHPPERIPDFIKKWEAGADVVVGVRDQNQGEGFVKHVGSKVYYKLMGFLSETELVPGETDFRLIDRKVIDAFKQFTERNRMTRALLNWLGFKRAEVIFTANARLLGKPGYSPLKLTRLALSSFVAHSLFPLKFAGYLGLLIMLVSGVTGVFVFYVKYIANDPWGFNFSGPATLAIINTFLVGIVLACLGLIALYVGTIHEEVANRPLYIVRTKK
jgi:dolichol-phosphate mannosyltransferase